MAKLFNRVRMTVSGTPGTGTITLGAAYSNAFMTFAEAGVANADVVRYMIEDGTDFEYGLGTYTSSGTTLSRDTVGKSKISGTAGTTKLTLTSAAVVRISGLAEDILSFSADQTFTAAEQAQARKNISAALKGHLFGLTLTNGTDATNDIDIAAGEAASTETNPVLMVLASALTKQLDAAWAVGTNQGGLDTGSIANATYHIWLIQRSDTGVVDALFSTSASAPTMPTSYDRKRLIGSIVRASATIKAFVQDGDTFRWLVAVQDVNAANPGTSAVTRTLTVPTGRRLRVDITVGFLATASAGPDSILISDLSLADSAPSFANGLTLRMNAGTYVAGSISGAAEASVMTDTSAQVRSRIQTSAADVTLVVSTRGWTDRRGRDA